MRGRRLLYLTAGVLVVVFFLQPLIYGLGGANLVMVVWGLVFLGSSVIGLLAPDAVRSADQLDIPGIDIWGTYSETAARFVSGFFIVASVAWCIYWGLRLIAGKG